MTGTKIQRPGRRSSLLPLTCGCLAGFGIMGVILIVGVVLFLPEIGARLAGLTPSGSTNAVFAGVTPQPTIQLQNPTSPSQVTVDLGQYGQQTVGNTNPQLYDFTLGTGAGGVPMAMASFTEQGLMEICYQRSTVCTANSSDPRFRNARIDLRPGGAVIFVDVTLPQLGGLQQRAGIVLQWNSASRRVVLAGVDLNGALYTTPPEGLGATIADLEQRANDLIQQLAVEAGGGRYTLADAQIDETTLTVILR